MGTGIVSDALGLAGQDALAHALLVIAVAVVVALVLRLARQLVTRREQFLGAIRSPTAFTAVAAVALVATHLARSEIGEVLLVICVAAWAGIMVPVSRNWRTPTTGTSFLPVVAAQALSVLASTLAARTRDEVLAIGGVALFAAGVGLYPFVAGSFNLRELIAGRGDQWIAGGALAISTLAATDLAVAMTPLTIGGGATRVLEDVAFALWVAALLWLPALLVCEVRFPRLRHHRNRWSSVFPVGMYCACTITLARIDDLHLIASIARRLVWVAFALWLAAAVGECRLIARSRRSS